MTQDESDILAEAAKIVNEASERLESERAEGVGKEFLQLEGAMWQQMGKPEGKHSLFGVLLIDSEEDLKKAQEEVKKHPERLVQGRGTIDGQKPDSMLGLSLAAEGGQIYEMLEDKFLSLALATDEQTVGVLARMDAYATDNKKGERVNACITMMLLAEAIYVAVRSYDDPSAEVEFTTIHADDYEAGKDRLVDAMLLFFAAPKAMYSQKPKVMRALYQDLLDKRSKQDKQQSTKEDDTQ